MRGLWLWLLTTLPVIFGEIVTSSSPSDIASVTVTNFPATQPVTADNLDVPASSLAQDATMQALLAQMDSMAEQTHEDADLTHELLFRILLVLEATHAAMLKQSTEG